MFVVFRNFGSDNTGLQNRLVNKEIKLLVAILDFAACASGQMCGAKHCQAHSGLFILFSFFFPFFSVNSC